MKAKYIKVGDNIKVYRGYAVVINIREASEKRVEFFYRNIDGILNWITYGKETNVKTK